MNTFRTIRDVGNNRAIWGNLIRGKLIWIPVSTVISCFEAQIQQGFRAISSF